MSFQPRPSDLISSWAAWLVPMIYFGMLLDWALLAVDQTKVRLAVVSAAFAVFMGVRFTLALREQVNSIDFALGLVCHVLFFVATLAIFGSFRRAGWRWLPTR